MTCVLIYRSVVEPRSRALNLPSGLRGLTVLVSLGSSVDYDENKAREFLGAVQILLQNTDMHVLWKFSKRGILKICFRM